MKSVRLKLSFFLLLSLAQCDSPPSAPQNETGIRPANPPFDILYVNFFNFSLETPLMLIKAEGTPTRKLTKDVFADRFMPRWSPDGKKIAFQGYTLDNLHRDIFVFDVSQNKLTRLTNDSWYDFDPSWSPDGSRIIWWKMESTGFNTYMANSDGSLMRKVRDRTTAPRWCPDGDKIVCSEYFWGSGAIGWQISVLNWDGTKSQRLTSVGGNYLYPAWSHDGTRIAYECINGPMEQIWVMDSDGANQKMLADSARNIEWSPDDSQILFTSGGEVYVINSDGSKKRRLTFSQEMGFYYVNAFPKWSPDGKKIAFSGNLWPPPHGENELTHFQVFMINADGSDLERLTYTDYDEVFPVWRPVQLP